MKVFGLILAVLVVVLSGGCASTGGGVTYHYKNGQMLPPAGTPVVEVYQGTVTPIGGKVPVYVYPDRKDQIEFMRHDVYERDHAHERAMDWARLAERQRRDAQRAAERAARQAAQLERQRVDQLQRGLTTWSRESRNWAEFHEENRPQPIVIDRPSRPRPRPSAPVTRPHTETRSRSSAPSVSRRSTPAPSRSVERARPSRSAESSHVAPKRRPTRSAAPAPSSSRSTRSSVRVPQR